MHNFRAFLKSRLCFEIKLTTSFGIRQRPRTGISKLFHQEEREKHIAINFYCVQFDSFIQIDLNELNLILFSSCLIRRKKLVCVIQMKGGDGRVLILFYVAGQYD